MLLWKRLFPHNPQNIQEFHVPFVGPSHCDDRGQPLAQGFTGVFERVEDDPQGNRLSSKVLNLTERPSTRRSQIKTKKFFIWCRIKKFRKKKGRRLMINGRCCWNRRRTRTRIWRSRWFPTLTATLSASTTGLITEMSRLCDEIDLFILVIYKSFTISLPRVLFLFIR